jgi:uncharacterized protein YceK
MGKLAEAKDKKDFLSPQYQDTISVMRTVLASPTSRATIKGSDLDHEGWWNALTIATSRAISRASQAGIDTGNIYGWKALGASVANAAFASLDMSDFDLNEALHCATNNCGLTPAELCLYAQPTERSLAGVSSLGDLTLAKFLNAYSHLDSFSPADQAKYIGSRFEQLVDAGFWGTKTPQFIDENSIDKVCKQDLHGIARLLSRAGGDRSLRPVLSPYVQFEKNMNRKSREIVVKHLCELAQLQSSYHDRHTPGLIAGALAGLKRCATDEPMDIEELSGAVAKVKASAPSGPEKRILDTSITATLDEVLPPSKLFTETVNYPAGTEKARKMRDMILEASPNGEASPKLLPKWGNVVQIGRLPNGNISAQKIQQWIDQQPKQSFMVDMDKWDEGLQQHNDQPSTVLRFNVTDDHLNEIEEAGLSDAYQNLKDESFTDSHPISKHGIGWVRFTAVDKDGRPLDYGADGLDPKKRPPAFIHIDEIQSDFGQNIHRRFSLAEYINDIKEEVEHNFNENTVAHGIRNGGEWHFMEDSGGRKFIRDVHNGNNVYVPKAPWDADYLKALLHETPEEREAATQKIFEGVAANRMADNCRLASRDQTSSINSIILGSDKKHTNVAIHEAFQQWCRDQGWGGSVVTIADTPLKALLSNLDLDRTVVTKDGKRIISYPGHMLKTYGQQPVDMGWEPSTYGATPAQDNSGLKRMTIFKVRKPDEPESEDLDPQEIPSPTHIGVIRKFEDFDFDLTVLD